VRVRRGVAADAGPVAHLHAAQITEGFLSSLGPRFLAVLYRRVTRADESFLLVAEADGHLAGFLAGATDTGALYRRFLRRDGPAAAAAAGHRLVLAVPKVVETLRHVGGAAPDPAAGCAGAEAELLAVAVDPAWRGRNVGGLLVDAFLAECARRGLRRTRVVVGKANGPAVAVYRRAGFVPVEEFELHAGTVSLLMRWPAPGSAAAGPG